jgi:hypothetical protein
VADDRLSAAALARLPPAAYRAAAKTLLYREDFPLFAREELRILTKDMGIVPFVLYPFQRRLWSAIDAQRRRQGFVRQVWLKGRQPGSSTFAQAVLFWRAILNANVNAITVAHEDPIALTLFEMMQRYYDRLSADIRPMVRYRTKGSFMFDNPDDKTRSKTPGLGSRLTIATAKNVHASAGGTYHGVILSEAARYADPEGIVSTTLQTVPLVPDTYVIIESTAQPEGSWFHTQCEKAASGDPNNPYEFRFISIKDDPTCWAPMHEEEKAAFRPTRDEKELIRRHALAPELLKWRRLKLAGEFHGDEAMFSMEYPLTPEECWVTAAIAAWPRDHLQALQAGVAAPEFRADVLLDGRLARIHDGALSVWQAPRAGALYDIGVDTAMSRAGGDFTVACVVERRTQQQVAEWRGKIEPHEFTDVVLALARAYNTAQLNIEVNDAGGYMINHRCSEVGYPNVYIWRRRAELVPHLTNKTGWHTTRESKNYLVAVGKARVYEWVSRERDRFPLIRSPHLLAEMETFVRTGTDTYAALGDRHDDCVMAWLFALVAAKDEMFGLEGLATPPEAVHTSGGAPDWSRHASQRMADHEAAIGRRPASWLDLDGWR